MKTIIIILIIFSFVYSSQTNICLDPVYIYQEYVIMQKKKKEKKDVITKYLISAPMTIFFVCLGLSVCKKPKR